MVLEKPELLKEWLISTLRKMSDADPIALGKYILALVKKDKKDMKSFLLEQLEVFLLDDTSKFVELLLETLLTKSYLKPSSNDVPSTDSSHPHSNKAPNSTDAKIKESDTSDVSSNSNSEKSNLKRKGVFNDNHQTIKKEPYSSSSKDALVKDEYVPSSGKTTSQDVKYKPSSKKMKRDKSPHDDKERESDHGSNASSLKILPNLEKKHPVQLSTRCKDYDEKGYCLLGNFCGFDHGNDPILVENLKSVNFGVNLPPDGTSSPPPLPPLPPAVPRLPPPPLPPPEYAEPYNPESPGMNLVPPMGYFDCSVPPPPLPPIIHNPSIGVSSTYYGKPEVYNKQPKQERVRELISVNASTKYSNTKESENRPKVLNSVLSSNVSKEPSNQTHRSGDFQGRRFDFSRLGPCPRTTLEIRKIPSKQNTIKNLYQHFGKYGNIINIEVLYDNDPEAAIVTFSTNSEATAAYRSTEAILDNRFIKVFWNNDGQKRKMNPNFLKEISSIDFSTPSVTENAKSVPLSSTEEKFNEKPLMQKVNPRSVYVCQSGPENKKVFSKSNIKKPSEQEGDIAAHKLKLYQAKTELLHKTVKDQKLILDQLMKATKKQKVFLKQALDSISKQVEELTRDLKKENEELKAFLKTPTPITDPKNATKELLDAELELYKKQHTNSDEDTTELLLKKVNFMKSQAKALGLIQPSPRGHPKFFKRKINRYSLSLDNRTKKANNPFSLSNVNDSQADVGGTTDIIEEREPDVTDELQSVEVEVDDEEEEDKEDSEARSWRH